MSAYRVPKNTELRRIEPNPQEKSLMEQGIIPPMDRYTYGNARILCCPPYRMMGWYMSISRPDHLSDTDEIQFLAAELIPHNIKVSAYESKEYNADGFFIVEIMQVKDEAQN